MFVDLCSSVGREDGELNLEVDKTLSRPTQVPARQVPVALKNALKAELDISTVEEPTDWTSGIVVVHKSNGSLRICIDPQQLNKGLKRRTYQVPTVEELLPELTKARVFSKWDVKSGFWHIKLDEASSKLTTFSTPFGRYKRNRMPFGIAPAPEIFQCRLEQALLGLPGVRNIHDDIIVFGEGDSIDEAVVSHDARMLTLLQRCEEQNIVLNDSEGKFICKTQRLSSKIHQWTIYFCRWGFGWVDKAQCFRSARRFGAAGSSPDFSRVFRDMALLGLCLELSFSVLYCRTQANLPTLMREKLRPMTNRKKTYQEKKLINSLQKWALGGATNNRGKQRIKQSNRRRKKRLQTAGSTTRRKR